MLVPSAALLPVAGCALAWAALDLCRKLLAGRAAPVPLLLALTVGPLPLFLLWVWVAPPARFTAGYWLPGLLSVALNVVANLGFLRAMAVSPLSVTIPLLSLTPAFTTLLAVPLLGELPTPRQWVGVLAVAVGAFLLNRVAGERLRDLLRAFRREPGAVMMAGVALLWSLALPLDKLALERASAPLHATVLNAGVALAMLVVLVARRRLGELHSLRGSLPLLLAALLASTAGLGLQLWSIRFAPVGLVETLKRGFGSVAALVVGSLFLNEAVHGGRVGAILLMTAGVGLILL